jgi:hypothetical protein
VFEYPRSASVTTTSLGVVVEGFRAPAGRDAWAAERFRSGRDLVGVVLDAHHGETERHTVSVSQIETDGQANGKKTRERT